MRLSDGLAQFSVQYRFIFCWMCVFMKFMYLDDETILQRSPCSRKNVYMTNENRMDSFLNAVSKSSRIEFGIKKRVVSETMEDFYRTPCRGSASASASTSGSRKQRGFGFGCFINLLPDRLFFCLLTIIFPLHERLSPL